MMQSIAQLLQAADFIERREREAEHGYASTLPMPDTYSKKRTKGKKGQGNRSSHNELEKNRRAQLRNCLEQLKSIVPLGQDTSRHTTLGLLTKAKGFIKLLEDKERKQACQKENLRRERRHLQRKLETLTAGQYRVRQERSISECSTSTNSTSTSTSESDEVDILGYNSSPSDTDDHSSILSGGSDGCGLDNNLTYMEDSNSSDVL
ncbi:hypothetical protein LOTGIDRAFT_220594 [Lottia gigantea]|uniref:BHLH domain-containing protein n=1 Tax=Lottia gigantea TaxID=225164 RepID=V3Z6W0_LOTGI|nr:hypothetical protein LOTGIDRAFT_220594 [Lottia gigantea]ESO86553.1 hypothetical protein LOTGIDRAFT_220594 [Lottia gigantea]